MVEHRRTVSRRGSVRPTWYFVVVALISVGGVAALGYVAYDAYGPTGADDVVATPSASPSPTPTPTPSPSPTASPTPSPSPTPTPTPSPTPEVTRDDIAVSVLNTTRVTGLAAQVGGLVTQAGWTLNGTGNWRGGTPQNTVHHPPGREAEAQLLADDLGIGAVAPSLQGMSPDRLTVLLLSLP